MLVTQPYMKRVSNNIFFYFFIIPKIAFSRTENCNQSTHWPFTCIALKFLLERHAKFVMRIIGDFLKPPKYFIYSVYQMDIESYGWWCVPDASINWRHFAASMIRYWGMAPLTPKKWCQARHLPSSYQYAAMCHQFGMHWVFITTKYVKHLKENSNYYIRKKWRYSYFHFDIWWKLLPCSFDWFLVIFCVIDAIYPSYHLCLNYYSYSYYEDPRRSKSSDPVLSRKGEKYSERRAYRNDGESSSK